MIMIIIHSLFFFGTCAPAFDEHINIYIEVFTSLLSKTFFPFFFWHLCASLDEHINALIVAPDKNSGK
jgi:hypothetical protein